MNGQSLVILIYFIVVIGATWYGVRKNDKALKEGGDFASQTFKGGGRIGAVGVAVLVSAGAVSTGTFIACVGRSAAYGPGYMTLFLYIAPVTFAALILTGKRMAIVGRRVSANSLVDVFRARFDNSKMVVVLLVIATVVFSTASAAGEFVGGSRAIEASAGIPYRVSLIVFAAIITLYVALGGMTGVTTVAIIQGFVMCLGSVILMIGYVKYFGSFGAIFDSLKSVDPALLTPNDGGTMPMLGIFEFWVMFAIMAVGQPWVSQGSLTYNNTKTMKRGMIIGTIMLLIWGTLVAIMGGAAARAFDPALDETMIDYATSTLSMGILPSGLAGIVLSAAAGAGQSTIGAIFICVASAIVNDVYKRTHPQADEAKLKKVMRITTVCLGIATILIALTEPATLHILLNFCQGGCAASILPALTLALYWPRATKEGISVGMLFGMVFYIINYSFDIVGFLHQAPMVCTIPLTFIIMIVVSKMTAKPSKEVVKTFFCEM